ncbi:MAG: CBS domain-containing protein [Acidobacteriota bacterium]
MPGPEVPPGNDRTIRGTAIAPLLLAMLASSLMTRTVATCSPADDLEHVVGLMLDRECGSVVVDKARKVLGIITDRDVCRAAHAAKLPLRAIPARAAMTRPVVTCKPEDPLLAVAHLMEVKHVRRVPVVDRGKLVGIITLDDIAREVSRIESLIERGDEDASARGVNAYEVGWTLSMLNQRRRRRHQPRA